MIRGLVEAQAFRINKKKKSWMDIKFAWSITKLEECQIFSLGVLMAVLGLAEYLFGLLFRILSQILKLL